jgi:hypothetical protein
MHAAKSLNPVRPAALLHNGRIALKNGVPQAVQAILTLPIYAKIQIAQMPSL